MVEWYVAFVVGFACLIAYNLYRLRHQDRLGASGQGQRRGSSRKNVDESEFGEEEDAGVPSLDLNDQGMSSFH